MATDGGYCQQHAAQAKHRRQQQLARSRPTTAARGYDAAWRKIRAEVLSDEPCCRLCKAQGKLVRATVVDHIKPLARGGTHDKGNLQPLCTACHNRKTATVDGGFASASARLPARMV
jgi:5-methylcytosine-specific restriction enzyme A